MIIHSTAAVLEGESVEGLVRLASAAIQRMDRLQDDVEALCAAMGTRLQGVLGKDERIALEASLTNLDWNVRYDRAITSQRRTMIAAKVHVILNAANRKGLTFKEVLAKFSISVLRLATEEELKKYGTRLGASSLRGGKRALTQALKQISLEVGGKPNAMEEPGPAR
jgi:hypothetical protein